MMRALLTVAGCASIMAGRGPVPVDQAEQDCFRQAQLASHPRGYVYFGSGTGGAKARADLTISSDYLTGQDPAKIYDSCVYQESGQPPRRPLYDRPDWKG